MTIWIDPPMWPAHGRLWSHLVSDRSLEELHTFALGIGIPERGFEGDHYDVPQDSYQTLVAAGAQPTDAKDLLRRLRDSGLRVQKRRSERVLVSTADPSWLPAGGRADVIASRQEEAPANTVMVRVALLSQWRLWVTERRDGQSPGLDLPSALVAGRTVQACLNDLVAELLGHTDVVPVLRGYVRNVVPVGAADPAYRWPVPRACFAVWSVPLTSHVAPRCEGRWLTPQDAPGVVGGRHWWPLFAAGLD